MDTQLSLQKDVESLLEDYRPFHDDTQIESFIAMKAGDTPWGWYVQCLREINKRNDASFDMRCSLETVEIDIAELELEAKEAKGFLAKRIGIDRRRKLEERARIVRTLTDCVRELERFTSIAFDLRKQHNFVNLEDKDKRTLAKDMWAHRIAHRLRIEQIFDKGLTKPTFELLASVPEDVQSNALERVRPESAQFVRAIANRVGG